MKRLQSGRRVGKAKRAHAVRTKVGQRGHGRKRALCPPLYQHEALDWDRSVRNGPAGVATPAGPVDRRIVAHRSRKGCHYSKNRDRPLHRTRMVEGTKGSHHKEGSRKMSKHSIACAGIDTGKRKLDVALHERPEQLQVDNTPDGHNALSTWLRRHRIKRIGIEASGGYEQAVVAKLRRDRFVVIVLQPAQVRAYAKFHLQRAKNDKIDAALIAACTAATKNIHAPPDPRLAPFAEHLTFIEQLSEDIIRLKARQETCRDPRIRDCWNAEIARLKALRRGGRAANSRRHPGAHAGDRPPHPRASRSPHRPCSLRRRQRRARRRPPYRWRPRATAQSPLLRGLARSVPLEPAAHGSLQTSDCQR